MYLVVLVLRRILVIFNVVGDDRIYRIEGRIIFNRNNIFFIIRKEEKEEYSCSESGRKMIGN